MGHFILKRRSLKKIAGGILWLGCLVGLTMGYYKERSQLPTVLYGEVSTEWNNIISISEKNGSHQVSMVDNASSTNAKMMEYRLFGFLPIKEVMVSQPSERQVYPGGEIVGIYGKTTGVLVLGTGNVTASDGTLQSPVKDVLREGDYILEIDGKPVNTKAELIKSIQEAEHEILELTYMRDGEKKEKQIHTVCNGNGEKMIGAWIKDDMAGIGTISYVDEEGNYGSLGHGIGSCGPDDIMSMEGGTLYEVELIGIDRGQKGTPGQIKGRLHYGLNNRMGLIEKNTSIGVYGKVNSSVMEDYREEKALVPIGYKQEIELGKAFIYSEVSGELKAYQIEIMDLDFDENHHNKSIIFKVTDEGLLEETGGIIQGMSGSPIIQNGKIVGAVTHVLINNPSRGYGIFIENMLEH